jgi:hypothetical protein
LLLARNEHFVGPKDPEFPPYQVADVAHILTLFDLVHGNGRVIQEFFASCHTVRGKADRLPLDLSLDKVVGLAVAPGRQDPCNNGDPDGYTPVHTCIIFSVIEWPARRQMPHSGNHFPRQPTRWL